MTKQVPLEAPWKARNAKEWDRMTVQHFFEKHIWTNQAMELARQFVIDSVTSEPYEVSLLWFLWYLASAGGPLRINATQNGGQERKFIGGAQQISEGLANTIGKDKVLLNRAVCRIEMDSSGVHVDDVHGHSYKALHCVVAIPPSLQNRIRWSPPLPARRIQMLQRIPMGSVIKTFMYYKTPFWREKGMCGSSGIDDDEGLVGTTMDSVMHDGTHPAILGFIMAEQARVGSGLSKEERKERIRHLYAKVFESEEALHPVHYEEMNWCADEWTGGGYTATMPPGFLTTFGEDLRKPLHGRVHFAGTETATQWTGYMEGAIEAGERAAKEILHSLGMLSAENIWENEPEDPDIKASSMDIGLAEKLAPSLPCFICILFLALLAVPGLTYTKLF